MTLHWFNHSSKQPLNRLVLDRTWANPRSPSTSVYCFLFNTLLLLIYLSIANAPQTKFIELLSIIIRTTANANLLLLVYCIRWTIDGTKTLIWQGKLGETSFLGGNQNGFIVLIIGSSLRPFLSNEFCILLGFLKTHSHGRSIVTNSTTICFIARPQRFQ